MSKPRKPFQGELAKRIDQKTLAARVLNTLSPEYAARLRAEKEANQRKLHLLFDHYGIDRKTPEPFVALAASLAADFVPGFQVAQTRGRPLKWGMAERALLVADIEYTAENDGRRQGVKWACSRLARVEPWRSFINTRERADVMSTPGEALRQIYNKAKTDKFAESARKACATVVSEEGKEGWRRWVASAMEEKAS